MSTKLQYPVRDIFVPAAEILRIAEMDLGFEAFPSRRETLVALSIVMNMKFNALRERISRLVAKEDREITSQVEEGIMAYLALNFVERYGALGLFSTDVLRVMWEAQRPACQSGPKRLRQLGQKLARFALACKDDRPKKTIDIGFKLFKSDFLIEFDRLSLELGALACDDPGADQLLELVKRGHYTMLKLNFRYLEEFLLCSKINPDLGEMNTAAVKLLAQYGAGKELHKRRSPSMTPDMFYYTWIAFVTNKKRSTVRREIQTAEKTFKNMLQRLFRVTKKR